MRRIRTATGVLAIVLLFSTGRAGVGVQTHGSEELGRVWIGVYPVLADSFVRAMGGWWLIDQAAMR
jgi:hypothetical protein